MKIGVNLMLWTGRFTRREIPLIAKVKRMGFDGVEIPIFAPAKVDVAGTRRALADHGLGVTVSTSLVGGNLIGAAKKERRAALDYLWAVLDVARGIGATCVAGPLYAPVGYLVGRGPNADEWKRAVEGLRELADTAEILGVDLAVEPLNRFETYFLNTCADTVRLVKEIGSPRVGVLYDTFHANIEEKDPVAALRRVGRQLVHVHASENDRGIPGSGHVPWDETIRTLRAMGYDGWLTIESFVPAIRELASAASIWRPLARSGDELARRGLRFLRGQIE